MLNKNQQMAQEFGHLFFSFNQHMERGEQDKANEISKKQDLLLKQLKENGYDIGALLEELKTRKLFQKKYETIIVFTDGGVRNNHDNNETSIAASAFAVYGDQKMLSHDSIFIGDELSLPSGETVAINSTFAEYHGLLQALLFVEKYKAMANRVIFLTDCASMVQHLTGKLPQQRMFKEYAFDLINRLKSIPNVELKHIPREHNKITDGLVNQLLDMYERGEKVCN
ncbi:reverse transcriptase-like protein [Gottfriedia acidiceleris]|uniref:reverse transcriptase-like protein n=1 Tax=Gottfriedia acidiceleris TaxID=371036 RepID=UPI0033910D2F